MTLDDEKQSGMIRCPYCRETLLTKRVESYKSFYICSNIECNAVSIIVTTTSKV
ncbi:hypothetical protein ES705_37811 [subsurface metagenome]